MAETFLSDAWFDAVEKIRAEIGEIEVPAGMADLKLNIIVTGGPEGDKEIAIVSGNFERGLVEGAGTKLTVPYDTAKGMFVEGNQQAAMQAFMSGQIKVEGDMSKLMAMQSGGQPGPGQKQLQEKIKEITA